MINNDNNKKNVRRAAVILRLGDILHDSDGLVTLIKLNLIFIFTCLPFIPLVSIFTAGPAIKALLHCTNHMVRTGYLPDVKNKYMTAFKANMVKSVRTGAAVVIFSFVFVAGLYFYLIMSGGNMFYVPFASVSLLMLLFIWSIATHMFPVLNEKDDLTFKELFSLSVGLALSNLPKTIFAVIISIIAIAAQILFLPASLPLILTIGFSVPALCCAFAHTEPEFV